MKRLPIWPGWKDEHTTCVGLSMHWTELLDEPSTTIAVVGATDSRGKFGFHIYRDLKRKGYRVFPVNPNRLTVDGDVAYPSLTSLPERPDIIDLVVPSAVGAAVAVEAARLGLDHLWVQPGAEGPELREVVDGADLSTVEGRCIMVEAPHHQR